MVREHTDSKKPTSEASGVGYSARTPDDWTDPPPKDVAEALDKLAARGHEESITLLAPGMTVVI